MATHGRVGTKVHTDTIAVDESALFYIALRAIVV